MQQDSPSRDQVSSNTPIQAQDAQVQINPLTAHHVSEYLTHHPHFFEQHASLLTEIFLPSPHGNGAISLTERQQLAQRDKIRVLEAKLSQLIDFAEENDITSIKVHNLGARLLINHSENIDFVTLQQTIADSLQQDFTVAQIQLQLWAESKEAALMQNPAFIPTDESVIQWVSALSAPFCGTKPALVFTSTPEHLKSFAFIPLAKTTHLNPLDKQVFGVLILSSENQQRFSAGMGTMYLERIGEIVGAALLAYIKVAKK